MSNRTTFGWSDSLQTASVHRAPSYTHVAAFSCTHCNHCAAPADWVYSWDVPQVSLLECSLLEYPYIVIFSSFNVTIPTCTLRASQTLSALNSYCILQMPKSSRFNWSFHCYRHNLKNSNLHIACQFWQATVVYPWLFYGQDWQW